MQIILILSKQTVCWRPLSLWFCSSRTAWRWSIPAFLSSASEATGGCWHLRAGTTECECSAGRSCGRWRSFSTTRTWCSAWPSLITRTPRKDCWPLGPRTSASACGPFTTRMPTHADSMSSLSFSLQTEIKISFCSVLYWPGLTLGMGRYQILSAWELWGTNGSFTKEQSVVCFFCFKMRKATSISYFCSNILF